MARQGRGTQCGRGLPFIFSSLFSLFFFLLSFFFLFFISFFLSFFLLLFLVNSISPLLSSLLQLSGRKYDLMEGDFIVLAVDGKQEIDRIAKLFVHRGKNQKDNLFVVVRWFVPKEKDRKTGWEVLAERKVDHQRRKYPQVYSFLSIRRKCQVEHFCNSGCCVEKGQVTKIMHASHETFLVNPWMS